MRLFNKPTNEAGAAWPAIVIGLFVSFGGVLYGYDTGLINGILEMPYWEESFSTGYRDTGGRLAVSPQEQALIVSILSAGTFIGALASPTLGDWLGRRMGLILSTWVFNFGVILQTISVSIPLFSAGRFFAGVGVGLISALVPLYQSETAPKWVRGLIVGAYQLSITIGLLLAAIVNNSSKDRPDTGSYRIPVGVQFAWSLVLFAGMLMLPETPRFLIRKGRMDKAVRALARVRRLPETHASIHEELAEIKANHDYEMSVTSKGGYMDCFRKPMRKRLFTGVSVQALQQLTGVNFIFYYGTKYFQNSGFTNAFVISMITSSINVVSTLPGLYAIDRWGRRPLLFWGAVGMCVSHLIVAILGTTTTGQDLAGNVTVLNQPAQKAAIAFVCIFIFFFASTWGPLAWVVTSEIFPLSVRGKALSITTASNWLFNWALAFSTPYLVDYGDGYANLQSKIFFIWFGATLVAIAFVYHFIYETKGLSLEEVDEMYQEVKVARRSVGWKPSGHHLRDVASHGSGDGLEDKERGSL
jgi:sugar porter (SP) family MFS transporter